MHTGFNKMVELHTQYEKGLKAWYIQGLNAITFHWQHHRNQIRKNPAKGLMELRKFKSICHELAVDNIMQTKFAHVNTLW